MSDNSTKANLIAKTLFIAGGIILFIVLVIFIFRIVPIAISNIKSFGTTIGSSITNKISDEKIKISVKNDTVLSNNPVIVSFEYEPKTAGKYFISYECENNLLFNIQSKEGPKQIICATPLNIGDTINTISLTPLLTTSNDFVDAKITIEYKDPEDKVLAFGTKIITVKNKDTIAETPSKENPFEVNGSLSGSTITSQPVTPTKTVQTTSTYSKPTRDLALAYIAQTQRDSSFVIHAYNYGNTTINSWVFSYTDAENPSKTVLSPVQASLKPGQGLAVTVQFDGQRNSRQSIQVILDPYNSISESSESNNSGTTIITGDSSNSNDSYDSNDDADLIITSMEVGRISGSRFVEDDEVDENDTAAIKFIVKNQGGESTGSWKFEINNLPYDNDDTYHSKSYSSLKPGQSIEIISEFEGIDEGQYSMKVEVDSDDDVDEEKENNNTESETLEVNN